MSATRIKKFDFKLAIGNGSALPDQLVQALFGYRAPGGATRDKSRMYEREISRMFLVPPGP